MLRQTPACGSLVCLSVVQFVSVCVSFFFQAEDGIRDVAVTGVQTCALPIYWAFPYFLVSAVAAGLVSTLSHSESWIAGLLVLPLIYLCHFWYQIHVERTVRVRDRKSVV